MLAPGVVPGTPAFDLECQKIFAQFDPPIVCGSYKDVRKKAKPGQQVEHFVVNGAFQSNRKTNTSIAGFKNYDQFKAFSYTVWDGQSKGTEHRYVTDRAKAFERANPRASTNKRIDAGKSWTKDSLSAKKKATKTGKPRFRLKNPNRADAGDVTAKAAECLAEMARAHFKKQGIDLDKPTKNAWKGKSRSASPAPAGRQRSTGRAR